jgi:uncharacterized protein YgfB (UPF0149 family)
MIAESLAFEELHGVLARHRAVAGAAEAHGVLAGALCAMHCSFDDWVSEILPEGRADDAGELRLRALFETTRGSLGDGEFTFMPLLPADEASIDARTEALGEWCRGFLYGLGSACLPESATGQAPVTEVLRDLAQISHAGVDPHDDMEESEQAYAELVEYVRVGVQLLHGELAPLRDRPAAGPARRLH